MTSSSFHVDFTDQPEKFKTIMDQESDFSELEDSSRQGTSGSSQDTFRFYPRVKERIEKIFYRHGLLCASRPWVVMLLSLAVFMVSCYPLLGIHLIHPSSFQSFITNQNDVVFNGRLFVSKAAVTSTASHHNANGGHVSSTHRDEAKFASASDHEDVVQRQASLTPRWVSNSRSFVVFAITTSFQETPDDVVQHFLFSTSLITTPVD